MNNLARCFDPSTLRHIGSALECRARLSVPMSVIGADLGGCGRCCSRMHVFCGIGKCETGLLRPLRGG